jgi:hypothetical protein
MRTYSSFCIPILLRLTFYNTIAIAVRICDTLVEDGLEPYDQPTELYQRYIRALWLDDVYHL